jgi:hypothetical protein
LISAAPRHGKWPDGKQKCGLFYAAAKTCKYRDFLRIHLQMRDSKNPLNTIPAPGLTLAGCEAQVRRLHA